MMDRFTDAFLDRVRAAMPISHVVGQYVIWDKSKGSATDRWACCPFHAERDPSFHVLDEEGIYKCFVCSDSAGDVFDFLVQISGVTFVEAVKTVAALAGIEVDQQNAPQGHSTPRPALPPAKVNQRQSQEPKAPKRQRQGKWTIFKTYDYEIDGVVQYQNVRIQFKMPDGSWELDPDTWKADKDFRQRRPSGLGDGSWVWGLKAGKFMRRKAGDDWRKLDEQVMAEWGPTAERLTTTHDVPHGIYRRSEVEIAIADGRTILFLEGEKAVDASWEIGQPATCNSGGGENFGPEIIAIFRGARVVASPDNDPQRRDSNDDLVFHPDGRPSFKGKDHAEQFCAMARGTAAWVGLLELPGLPLKGDIVEWIASGGTYDQLVQLLHTLPAWRPRPPISKFGAVSSRDVAGSEIVYDWLIKGLIERNGVFLIAGESLAGKSFLANDMAMKIARGHEYGGRKVRQGLVMYVAVEDGKGTKLRQKGYRKYHRIADDDDVPFIIMDPTEGGGFSLMSDESVDAFIAECLIWEEHVGQNLELIVIDTYSMATEGLDEIDGAGTGKVIGRLNRIRDKTGASVGVVHHMNGSGTRIRGHSSLVANVPNVIEVRPMMTIPRNKNEKPEPLLDGEGREKRRAILTKNKNGLSNVKWTFVLDVVEVGTDADGVPITTCVCARPVDNKTEDGQERQKLSPDQKLVYDALLAALDRAGQDIPHGAVAGPQVKRCAPQAAFVASVRKTMSFKAGEDEVEARNSEIGTFLKRTTTDLINGGYMGRDNDLKIVWWTGKSDRTRPRRTEPEQPPPGAGVPDDVMNEIRNSPVPF